MLKIHIDTKGYTEKPKEHISIIKPRLQGANTIKNIDLETLIKYIQRGYSISPAVMDGKGCKAENWKEQRLFMVDIDNDKSDKPVLSVSNALEICNRYNLPPAFYYYSFSHSEQKEKYRLCFAMNETVTNQALRAVIAQTLVKLFPQSDTSCTNADRIFYGTNKDVVICDLSATIDIENVLKLQEPQQQKQVKTGNEELDRLKEDFDFFRYLQERNGKTVFNNSKCAMFERCEICGHKKDLVYYHETKTFNCFGASGNVGGSVIDYIIAVEKTDLKGAIDRLYELSGITRPSKREYAIKAKIKANEGIVSKLIELDAYRKYSLDDKGFGALFAEVFKDTCRYNATAKEWYFYNGKVWTRDEGSMRTLNKAKELADGLLIYATTIEDEKQKQNYIDYVSKLGQLRFRETMVKDSRDIHFVTQSDFDKNLDLFNCQNGTLNLKTFDFTPHNSDDLLSKISNVIYEPFAKSEEWEKFINEVMQGDTDKTEYLQKILGYSLTADTNLETCFILYGATTRNGKSTLIETMLYMLGNTAGYGMSMQPQTLAQKQNKDSRQASGDIARLDGCRFLNASEPPKRMIFDVGLLKNLLGRDSITARHLHEREFEFIPRFKLFINTNFLPLITDDTLFTSGRINVITFDRHFEPHEQDKNLKNKLIKAENLSGILNWCIEGLKLYYKDGAKPPQAVTTATDEYRTNSDKIGNFIAECLEQQANTNTKALDVYIKYKEWCSNNGFGVENKGNFFDELRGKNIFAPSGTINGVTVRNVIKDYVLIRDEIEERPPYYSYSSRKSDRNYYD